MPKVDPRLFDNFQQLFAPTIQENQELTLFLNEPMTPYHILGYNLLRNPAPNISYDIEEKFNALETDINNILSGSNNQAIVEQIHALHFYISEILSEVDTVFLQVRTLQKSTELLDILKIILSDKTLSFFNDIQNSIDTLFFILRDYDELKSDVYSLKNNQ